MKKISFIVFIILIISSLAFISYLNSSDYLVNKVDELYLSKDYSEVSEEYGNFFTNRNYKQNLLEVYGDSYEDYLFSYETKYLVSLLAIKDANKFVDNFKTFTKELDFLKTIYFIQLFYDTINIDTNQNNELHKSIVELLNETESEFKDFTLNSYYTSMLCFLNFSISDDAKYVGLLQKLQLELDAGFKDFWDEECVKYCGSLLLNKNYDRFNVVFIKAYNNDFSSTKSVAIMINKLGCDNEQLQVLSKALKEVSNIQEKDTKKEAFKGLADLAGQQETGTHNQGTHNQGTVL